MPPHFQALSAEDTCALRDGGTDAHWQVPVRYGISDGAGLPCRNCLNIVPAGQGFWSSRGGPSHRPIQMPKPASS